MLHLVLIVLLILLIVGTLPSWPYSKAWGYLPCSLLGGILVILLMLILLERI
jgi:Protein of unknown function (DUF3309)